MPGNTFNLFDLYDHTALLTRAGSRAYGIHTSSSDIDIKGVAIPPARFIVGIEVFNQADKAPHFEDERFRALLSEEERAIVATTKLEGSIYGLLKFMRLAMKANPNILDVFFCRDSDILLMTKLGEILRSYRDLFLTAKAYWTFSRYAVAQMKRINTHRRWLLNPPKQKPVRADFALPEVWPTKVVEIAQALVKKKMDGWELDLSLVDGDAERLELKDQFADTLEDIISGVVADHDTDYPRWRAAVRGLGVDDNLFDVLDKEKRFKSAAEDWKKYQQWQKGRNPDRAVLEAKYLYDTKHGAHLVRLMRMCGEILETGRVNVSREGIDADELRSIRNGAWSYEKLAEFSLENDAKLKVLYESGQHKLPHHPDPKAIGKLTQELHQAALEERGWA